MAKEEEKKKKQAYQASDKMVKQLGLETFFSFPL